MKKINLNYGWFFKERFKESDLKINNFKGFKEVQLPHTNKETPLNNFDERISHFVSIYKRKLIVDNLDEIYELTFEGVGHYSKLYVNGEMIADHKCGYTSFEVFIEGFLHIGENEIALVVDSNEINQPPFGFVIDYLCFGGIYRDCYLNVYKRSFKNVFFHNDNKNWYIDFNIWHLLDINYTKIGTEVIFKDNDNIVYKKYFDIDEEITDIVKGFELWNINNPKLYDVTLRLIIDDEVSTTYDFKVGFRTLEFTSKGFYLNGNKIKIRGANRHQSYPYVGYAMPKRAQIEDARLIKELGFNAVRTSHYPQSRHFLDECDRLGLLVFEEIPGWQHVGDESWKEIAINNVRDMIIEHRNHPSIIMWGVRINESGDFHDFYTKTNNLAHECDPTRPTGGVRCFAHSELLEDIYTYNDFCCTGKDISLREKDEITNSDKPYLVSEYGGHMFPTKSFDNENRRTEHAIIHSRVIKKAYNDDNILGTFAWCFADYNTHKDFGSGDLICYHGVCDIFRNPKYASYPYQVFSDKPFLEVSSNMNIGEHNGGYIRKVAIMTNCDYVKMYHNDILVNTFVVNDIYNDSTIVLGIDELMGDLLITQEGLSLEESNKVKEIVNKILDFDGIIRKEIIDEYTFEVANKAWNYYGKYISNWGSHPTPYLFEGYKNDELVKSILKGPQYLDHIKVTTSTNELDTSLSYDVCKVTLEAIGTLGNRVDYCFDSFKIKTTPEFEVIGDKMISLIGGVRSFYVKTKVREGIGTITITSDRHKIKPIKLIIR